MTDTGDLNPYLGDLETNKKIANQHLAISSALLDCIPLCGGDQQGPQLPYDDLALQC